MSGVDAAIVTGGGRGIGKAIAIALADAGAATLCISRSKSCESTRDEIRGRSGVADSLVLDLADYEGAEREVERHVDTAPYRRYCIVLAAATLGPRGPLSKSKVAAWDEAFRVNVLGNLAVVRAALPRMLEAGFGRIVFLSGGGAAYEYPTFPAYAATKTALVRTVENMAVDLRAAGDFSVVCLAPGAVETQLLAEVRAAGAEVRTVGRAEDAARFVTAFCSRPAASLSGRFVHVFDEWERMLEEGSSSEESLWKLRRVE
ncbi:MAG: SDR family oxidoreductase [Gaiellaceae bacterium]